MNLKIRPLSMQLTFRKRVVLITIGMIIGALSFFFTYSMTRMLRVKEKQQMDLLATALTNQFYLDFHNPLIIKMLTETNDIPFLLVDNNLQVMFSSNIPVNIVHNPDLLFREMLRLSKKNAPIQIVTLDGTINNIFYDDSRWLKALRWFPFIQILVIIIFVGFGFIAFRSSKHDEQNRVWIGLAKETAHQLGTPTSSLLGWIEYMRSQPVEQYVVDEMQNDLTRLTKVVDRFSKIGSETSLTPANVNEVVGNSVLYFKRRLPKNVTLEYNGLAIAPVQSMLNTALFEWVVENLLKNSLDALQGKGEIDVKISSDVNNVWIDVSDTGKGIPKSNFKRIFEPGFTTKTRGWGLGLSLSRRIIETYHKGKIQVTESEPGKKTNFRISLKRTYY